MESGVSANRKWRKRKSLKGKTKKGISEREPSGHDRSPVESLSHEVETPPLKPAEKGMFTATFNQVLGTFVFWCARVQCESFRHPHRRFKVVKLLWNFQFQGISGILQWEQFHGTLPQVAAWRDKAAIVKELIDDISLSSNTCRRARDAPQLVIGKTKAGDHLLCIGKRWLAGNPWAQAFLTTGEQAGVMLQHCTSNFKAATSLVGTASPKGQGPFDQIWGRRHHKGARMWCECLIRIRQNRMYVNFR